MCCCRVNNFYPPYFILFGLPIGGCAQTRQQISVLLQYWWPRMSTTSISCWQQQQASSQLYCRGNRYLLPYIGEWWLRSGKETNFCFLVLFLGGGMSQQPASLVGTSNKHILSFLYVAIAVCCHTAASGGCAQARRQISVFWCSCFVAA